MDRLTSLMYDGAQEIYDIIEKEQPGEPPHGYGGVCAGLAKVMTSLGHNVDLRYFANRFHDVLSQTELNKAFVQQRATFADVVRQLDKGFHGFFGFDTSKAYDLPFEFANPDRNFRFSYESVITSSDLQWIVNEVKSALRTKKIRAGSKAYKEFVTENAQKVIDAVIRISQQKQESLAQNYAANAKKAEDLLAIASARVESRSFDWELHEDMLNIAGVTGSPKIAARHLEELHAWRHVQNELADKAKHYTEQSKLSLDHDRVINAALGALHNNDTLKSFPKAVGL